jgi:type IV pilus assembly protein PilX
MKPLGPRPARRRGVVLLSVMVIAMLVSMLVLGTARTAFLGEMMAGAEADHQRTLEAAHAMLRDAELDIHGRRADGTPCTATAPDAGHCRRAAFDRQGSFDADAAAFFFPPETARDGEQYQAFVMALGQRQPSCGEGICTPNRVPAAFWEDASALSRMKARAALYGQYTGALPGPGSNPLLLHGNGAVPHAWYWVELLQRADSAPNEVLRGRYVYRITAVAQGLGKGAQVVLQTLLVWKKPDV